MSGGGYRDDPNADLESGTSEAQRQRLLRGTQTLSDSTRRLEDSHRVALETEDLGAGILSNLRGQREQIEHTRDTLYTADNSIDRASGTLKQMIRRCAPALPFKLTTSTANLTRWPFNAF